MTYEAVVSLDIDSTQYVHYDASEDSASYVLKHTLESLKDAGKILVVHNTGRPYPWACHGEQIERYLKPIIADPNYLISHAGTVIWDSELKNPSEVWRNTILEICPPDAVQDLIRTLDREGYKFDPETFGNEFKVCIKTSPEEHPAAVASIKALITEKYPFFDVAYWNNTSVDITPRGINKSTALDFLRAQEGLVHLPVITGGDSMNDAPLLTNPSYLKILVGNALPELKAMTSNLPNIFQAQASHKAAAGVLAGLIHYGVVSEHHVSEVRASLGLQQPTFI